MTLPDKRYLILVGIDYSSASELALERALEVTSTHQDAELHVVHVTPAMNELAALSPTFPGALPATQPTDVPFLDREEYGQLRNYVAIGLAAFNKTRASTPPTPMRVVCHLRVHNPAQEIAQLASDLQADLVVVGMHGRGSVARFFLGSVAESVARLSPCSVLVVRPAGLPQEYPKIEPPCPRCLETRATTFGKETWCNQHRERHGQRHVYTQTDLVSQETNFPLTLKG